MAKTLRWQTSILYIYKVHIVQHILIIIGIHSDINGMGAFIIIYYGNKENIILRFSILLEAP